MTAADDQAWCEANVGQRFKRPRGRTVYKLREWRFNNFVPGAVDGVCEATSLDGYAIGDRAVSARDLQRMERIA